MVGVIGLFGAEAALAAQSNYFVQHQFGFVSTNWADVVTRDLGMVRYSTYARANGAVDQSRGTSLLSSGQAFLDNSHAFGGTAEADANSAARFNSVAVHYFDHRRRWQGIEYTFGQTSAYGWARAQDNTNSSAYATSSVGLIVGDARWGANGQFIWMPKVNSSVSGSATAVSRRLRDPIDIVWTDAQGARQSERLLDITIERTENDINPVLDWDAEQSVLSFAATDNAVFRISANSTWLTNPGSLTLRYDATTRAYELDTSGQFSGVVGDFDSALGRYTLNLGAIELDYISPVEHYGIELGGDGESLAVTTVPEPADYAMFIGGLLLLSAFARRRS